MLPKFKSIQDTSLLNMSVYINFVFAEDDYHKQKGVDLYIQIFTEGLKKNMF